MSIKNALNMYEIIFIPYWKNMISYEHVELFYTKAG